MTAKALNCSIGLVSESILLCEHWEDIQDYCTRQEALDELRSKKEESTELIVHERLNSISLHIDLGVCLRQFPPGLFNLSICDTKDLTVDSIHEIARALSSSSFAIFFSSFKQLETDYQVIKPKFKPKPLFIWIDGKSKNSYGNITDTTTPIIIATKGSPHIKDCDNTIYADGVSSTLKLHEREKPIELIERLMNITLRKKGNVLDPFCHSAEIPLACRKLGHNYYSVCRWEKEFERVSRKVAKYD